MMQQAEDFHDDPKRVVMWEVGHGASAAMIAGGNNPRIKAAVMQAPFPSGTLDCLNYPAGLLDSAWREQKENDGDDTTIFIKGVAAYHLMQGNKALTAAAGTP